MVVIPVIDLERHVTPAQLAKSLKSALETVGFIYLSNYGFEHETTELFDVAREWFALESAEEKQRCRIVNNKGYDKLYGEVLDPIANPEGDLKESINLGVIEGTPAVPTQPIPQRLLQHVEFLARFQQKSFDLSQRLLEAFAIALNLDSSFFTSQHRNDLDTVSILRLLHYPAVSPASSVSPNRAGAHSDYGSLTLLFVSNTEGSGSGLQLLPSTEPIATGRWVDVPHVEGAVLVNIGDAMEIWTAGRFKSSLHRVRLPEPIPAEGIPERFSVAYFSHARGEAILKSVLPTSEISSNDFERMSRKGVVPGVTVTAAQHLQARLDATYVDREV